MYRVFVYLKKLKYSIADWAFNCKEVILAGFHVATVRPARQRYDNQEAKRQRMKSVVLSRGGAKGRHAKTRKSDHLAGCRVAFFRLFTPKTR